MTTSVMAAGKMDDSDYIRRLEIKSEVVHLPKGSTTNDVKCPWCHEAKSFSVTKTERGDILFICHRAACSEAGYIRERGSSAPATTRRVFTPRMFDYPTKRLEGDGLSILVDRYGITPMEVRWAGWLYAPSFDALVMPVRSPNGSHRGHVTKAYDRTAPVKNLTFKEVDDLWMGWHRRNGVATEDPKGDGGTVIVVEDCISALKASRFAPAVALLGTHLNYPMVDEILSVGKNVVICLDEDATRKAYKYAEQFAVFGNFRTLPLSKDIKNMTEKELEEWSERLK